MSTKFESWLKKNPSNNDGWIWKRDAAKALGTTEKTLERYVSKGEITQSNRGRKAFYKISDLLRYERGVLKKGISTAKLDAIDKMEEVQFDGEPTFTLDEVVNLFNLFITHLNDYKNLLKGKDKNLRIDRRQLKALLKNL